MKRCLFMLPLMAMALASCSNEESTGNIETPMSDLKIQVGVNQPVSRALVEDSYFGTDVSLGLFVEEADGTAYDDQTSGYTNIEYKSTGTVSDAGTGQAWSAVGGPIRLSATPATLYAYYPYYEKADMVVTEIDVDNEEQDDWMYASKLENLSNSNPGGKVVMNHAQVAVKIVIKNSTTKPYNGEGNVTSVKIQSPCLGTTGKLNAKTGVISVTDADANDEMTGLPKTLENGDIVLTHMMLPVDGAAFTGTNKLTVTIVMDGKTFSNEVSHDIFTKGNMYKMTLTATSMDFMLGMDTNGDGVIDENDEPAVTVVPWASEIDLGEDDMNVVG